MKHKLKHSRHLISLVLLALILVCAGCLTSCVHDYVGTGTVRVTLPVTSGKDGKSVQPVLQGSINWTW